MRSTALFAATSGLLLAGVGLYAAGCGNDAGSCDDLLTCTGYADAGGPPDCSHPPMQEDGGPNPACGVFACPSAPMGGDGTQAKPYRRLATALVSAGGR